MMNQARIAAWVSGPLALASLVFGFCCGLGDTFNKQNPVKVAEAVILCAWITLPPVWFWYEYFFVWARQAAPKPTLDEFRYGQDVASKIWLGLVTALLGLYFGKDFVK